MTIMMTIAVTAPAAISANTALRYSVTAPGIISRQAKFSQHNAVPDASRTCGTLAAQGALVATHKA